RHHGVRTHLADDLAELGAQAQVGFHLAVVVAEEAATRDAQAARCFALLAFAGLREKLCGYGAIVAPLVPARDGKVVNLVPLLDKPRYGSCTGEIDIVRMSLDREDSLVLGLMPFFQADPPSRPNRGQSIQ